MTFYCSLWFSAFLSIGYWEWRQQLFFKVWDIPGKSPDLSRDGSPKIVCRKPDGKNENTIHPSVPFLHSFHIKSTWSINCVQHKIALGLERGWCHLPVASAEVMWALNYPRRLHWQTCLAPGPPEENRQAAVHAQIARRAKHIVTLLGIKSTQEVHWQQEPASACWGYYARNLCTGGGGGKRGGSTHTHAHTCTHATAKGSLVTSGSPAAGRRPDCLPGSARHLQRCLNYLHFLLSS